MTLEEAIATVRRTSGSRARPNAPPMVGELFVTEIDRLRRLVEELAALAGLSPEEKAATLRTGVVVRDVGRG